MKAFGAENTPEFNSLIGVEPEKHCVDLDHETEESLDNESPR